jgi:DNA-directed RNA polymerase specialized sigma24 family protein
MTQEEYGQAFEKGFSRTVGFLITRGVQRDQAIEVAQAAWVHGWERQSQLRVDSFVITWVNSIALNLYRSELRKSLVYNDGVNNSVTNIDLAAIDIARIIRFCSTRDQNLLSQSMNGFTTEEIALQEHTTETAVRIRLMRARRAARAQLNRIAALQRLKQWRRPA